MYTHDDKLILMLMLTHDAFLTATSSFDIIRYRYSTIHSLQLEIRFPETYITIVEVRSLRVHLNVCAITHSIKPLNLFKLYF